MQELPNPQRKMLQGGGLSQRFLNLPLDATHPAIIGALYGLLVGLSLILPIGYLREWDLSLWWRNMGRMVVVIDPRSFVCPLIMGSSMAIIV